MRRGSIITKETPKISDNKLYLLLRDEQIEEFNALRQDGEKCDLSGMDFRGLDLRGIETDGIDFSNAYFRQANQRLAEKIERKLDLHRARRCGK